MDREERLAFAGKRIKELAVSSECQERLLKRYAELLDFSEYMKVKARFRASFALLAFMCVLVLLFGQPMAGVLLFVAALVCLFLEPGRRADWAMVTHYTKAYEDDILDFRWDFNTIRSFDVEIGSFMMECMKVVRRRRLR